MENPFKTESKKADRSIETDTPNVLLCDTLEELAELLGADVAVHKITAQLKVDFRSKIRALLESETDGVAANSDDDILAMDFSDWKPELRVRKSAEEKAADAMGGLSIEQVLAALTKAGHNVTDLIDDNE